MNVLYIKAWFSPIPCHFLFLSFKYPLDVVVTQAVHTAGVHKPRPPGRRDA